MPVFKTSVTVPHRPEDMFALVSDIRRYPEFIRWIETMVVSGERSEGHISYCQGNARVGFRGFSERFVTNVTANVEELTVRAELVRGPLRRLRNDWSFHPIDGGDTRVDFYVDYEFSNIVLRMLARTHFDLALNRIMAAFIAEADRRHG